MPLVRRREGSQRGRAVPVKAGMAWYRVVAGLDPLEDWRGQLLPDSPGAAVEQLSLHGRPERLDPVVHTRGGLPIEPSRPASRRRWPKIQDVYCEPRSLCTTAPAWGRAASAPSPRRPRPALYAGGRRSTSPRSSSSSMGPTMGTRLTTPSKRSSSANLLLQLPSHCRHGRRRPTANERVSTVRRSCRTSR